MSNKRISGRYEYPATPGIDFDPNDPNSKSVTQQHFADEVDVNNIVARFVKTGVLGDPNAIAARAATFGDFSNVGDFQLAMNKVLAATKAFEALPLDIKNKFNNDPGLLIDFLADPKNNKEAQDLGLLPKVKTVEVTTAPEVTVPAAKPAAL